MKLDKVYEVAEQDDATIVITIRKSATQVQYLNDERNEICSMMTTGRLTKGKFEDLMENVRYAEQQVFKKANDID